MGTRFVSYDNGLNPKKLRNIDQRPSYAHTLPETDRMRQEFCAIMYEQNVLGIKGTKISKILPEVTFYAKITFHTCISIEG